MSAGHAPLPREGHREVDGEVKGWEMRRGQTGRNGLDAQPYDLSASLLDTTQSPHHCQARAGQLPEGGHAALSETQGPLK